MTTDAYERLARDFKGGRTFEIVIRLHVDGALSVQAPMGNVPFCLRLLDEARDAIKRQAAVVPASDVSVTP